MSNKWKRFFIVGVTAFSLTACSGDDSDDLCEGPASVAGEPDITGPMVFDTATIDTSGGTVDGTVTVDVPVDAETLSVVVDFAPVGDTATINSPMAVDVTTAGVAETVPVIVTIPMATLPGNYYPVIMLCSDTAANVATDSANCAPGAGYVEDTTNFISASNYVRGTTDGTTVNLGALSNSCVGISSITVN